MGSGVSSEQSPGELRAFNKVKQEYDNSIEPAIADGRMSEKEGMERLQRMYADYLAMAVESASPRPPEVPLPSTAEVKSIKETMVLEAGDRTRDEDYHLSLKVGDIVKVKDKGFYFEGVIMTLHDGLATVNFGDDIVGEDQEDIEKEFPARNCYLVLSGLEMEENDRVEVNTFGKLYCQGVIIAIHRKFLPSDSIVEVTYDVLMDNDEDEEDIEYNVHADKIRKIMSHRVSAAERWKRGWAKVSAAIAFRKMGALSGKHHK